MWLHESVCLALCQADSLCHRVAQEQVKRLMFTLCPGCTLSQASLLCLISFTRLPFRRCWQPCPSSASSHACWHHVDLLCLIFFTWLPCRLCWQPSPSSASSHACWRHVLRRPTATPCPSEWSCSTTTAMMLPAQS